MTKRTGHFITRRRLKVAGLATSIIAALVAVVWLVVSFDRFPLVLLVALAVVIVYGIADAIIGEEQE